MLKSLGIVLLSVAALSASAGKEIGLGQYSREARKVILDRVKNALLESGAEAMVRGVCTFAGNDHLYLQKDDDGLKVVYGDSFHLDNRSAEAGDVVEIVGRPALEGGRVVFLATSLRVAGKQSLPAPVKADADSLVSVSDGSSSVNWRRVEVSGRAIGLTENGFAIDVGGLPVTVVVRRHPDFLDDCEMTHPQVKIRGVAELVLDQSSLFRSNRYVMGVKLCVASPEAIELMPDVSYLLARRDRRIMAAVFGSLTLLAIALVLAALAIFRQRRRHFRTVTLMAERKRMADDIHDTIEQHLVGAGMLVRLGKTKETLDVLIRAKREIRDIVWGLKNDDMMRLTPTEMIKELAKEETRKGLYHVEARLVGMPSHLNASQMRDLSLIIREAIGNAVKHGRAKKIAISSDPIENGGWLLRIANDGEPFDPASALGPADGHFGLEGMRERARRLRAQVAFSRKGNWTVLSLEVKNDKGSHC